MSEARETLGARVAAIWEPEPPAPGSTRRFLIIMVGAFLLLVLRRPDLVTRPQFFWDDGVAFFPDQLALGPAALFKTYGGYVQLFPRVVALLLSPLPIRAAPFAYAVVALGIQAVSCAWFARPEFRRVVPSDALRSYGCALVAASPLAEEMLGAVAHAQWWVVWLALLWSLSPLPGSRAGRIAFGAAVALSSALLPGCAAFAPIWLARAVLRRERAERAIAIAALAGTALQVVLFAALAGDDPWKTSSAPVGAATVVRGAGSIVLRRVAAGPLIGMRDPLGAEDLYPDAAAWLCLVSLIGAFAVAIARPESRARAWSAALAASLALILLIILAGRVELLKWGATMVGWRTTERFFLVPCAVVAVAHVVALGAAPRPWRWVAVPALALFTASATLTFEIPAREDGRWPEHAARLESAIANGETTTIEVPLRGPPMKVRLDRGRPVPLERR